MTATAPRRVHAPPRDDLTAAFRAEAPGLLGYFLRRLDVPEDAADLVSDTFLAAWKQAQRRTIEPDMLRAWLYGIARKVLSQYRRGRRRRDALSDRLRDTLTSTHAEHPAANDTTGAHMRSLVAGLPRLDREIIALVYWEGFSQAEVATILGKPSATVRSRLARARSSLRSQIEFT